MAKKKPIVEVPPFEIIGGEKDIYIPFENLFPNEISKDEVLNTFNLSRKRIYLGAIPEIVQDLMFVANAMPQFFENYLLFKSSIDSKEINSTEQIIEEIRKVFLTDEFKKLITEYIKREHTISIEAKNNNEELQFTDSMARIIMCIATCSRLAIPLLSHYLFVNDIKKDDVLYILTFSEFYSFFDVDDEGTPVDIVSKLNKFISAAVDKTLYSDQVIWNYLRNISVHSKILSIELFKRILRDIIPKITLNKSIISYLHVVLKKQIEFQFTQNIKINFKPITTIRTDNENNNVNPFTRIEQKLVRANELDFMLNKEAINDFIKTNSVLKDPEEFNYYFQNVNITSLQVKFVNFFMNKFIGQGINIYHCDRREYIEMVMLTHAWLVQNKYTLLSQIFLSQPIPKQSKKNFNKGNLMMSILESKSYENIMNKYSIIQEKIVEGKTIINFVGEILNTNFTYFPLYNEPNNREVDFEDYPLRNGIGEILLFIERL